MTQPTPDVTWEDYARAEGFLPWNAHNSVFKAHVNPHWIRGGEKAPDRFWYLNRTREGTEYILVNPEKGTRERAFDHDRLAAALSVASGEACEGNKLPFDAIEFLDEGVEIGFEFDGKRWQCDLIRYVCNVMNEIEPPTEATLPSPDGRWELLTKNHNLCLREVEIGGETALTDDGEPFFDYASSPESNVITITNRRLGVQLPPAALWSPDSKRFITHRLDQRLAKDLYLLQSVPDDGSVRPVLHRYRYPMVGDEHVASAHLLIFDAHTGAVTPVQCPPQPTVFYSLIERNWLWWSEDGRHIYFLDRVPGAAHHAPGGD